ncbi:hypothetical protein [Nocardiopsis sp. B62]|uniref:hypothetical protein n=1 Tax=Nocardiopsis sp. B62 TaxID=2824874 RepID=UPI0027DBEC29|nr:hypothetical protein [Nocardiopsis sp. B62]
MTPIPEQILLAAPSSPVFPLAAALILAALVTCLFMAFRWNRRYRGPTGGASAAEAPTREERGRVAPYLRSGETAPGPELSRLTVASARELLRVWENPWAAYGFLLYLAWMALSLGRTVWSGAASPGVLAAFLPVLALLALVFVLRRRRVLCRSRQAIEANADLAAWAPPPEPATGWDQLRRPY